MIPTLCMFHIRNLEGNTKNYWNLNFLFAIDFLSSQKWRIKQKWQLCFFFICFYLKAWFSVISL
jgi:hypothetical protein